MTATDFVYDGKKLSDFGKVICSFDGDGDMDTITAGSEITFNTVSRNSGKKYSLTSTKYETVIEGEFDIMKSPCDNSDDLVWTDAEFRIIHRWLNRRAYKKFNLVQEDPTYYYASFNVEKIEIMGEIYGAHLTMTTNSPFGYGAEVTYSWSTADYTNADAEEPDENDLMVGFTALKSYQLKYKAEDKTFSLYETVTTDTVSDCVIKFYSSDTKVLEIDTSNMGDYVVNGNYHVYDVTSSMPSDFVPVEKDVMTIVYIVDDETVTLNYYWLKDLGESADLTPTEDETGEISGGSAASLDDDVVLPTPDDNDIYGILRYKNGTWSLEDSQFIDDFDYIVDDVVKESYGTEGFSGGYVPTSADTFTLKLNQSATGDTRVDFPDMYWIEEGTWVEDETYEAGGYLNVTSLYAVIFYSVPNDIDDDTETESADAGTAPAGLAILTVGGYVLEDTSDEIGKIYPGMVITMLEDGDVILTNSQWTTDRMVINNCTTGEVITIYKDIKYIESSLNSHDIYDDFNFAFLPIMNTYDDRTNEIRSLGANCTIKITYEPVRKIAI